VAASGAATIVLLAVLGGGWWFTQGDGKLAQTSSLPAATVPEAALVQEIDAADVPVADESQSASDNSASETDESEPATTTGGEAPNEPATAPPAEAGDPAQGARPEPAPVTEPSAEPAAQPAAEAAPATQPIRPVEPAPRPRSRDLRARLATPLDGLKFEDVALADVLATLSQLAGVPLALDAHHVPDAGRLAAMPISADLGATTVGAAAATVTRDLGLEGVLTDGQVLFEIRGMRPGKSAAKSYDLADLTASLDEAQATELREFLARLAGNAPRRPAAREFKLTATPAQHRLVAECLARIREARQTGSSKPAAARDERWSRRLTLNFRQPTPLVQVLPEVEREARMTVLVDWPALDEAGLGLDSQVSFVAHDQSLHEALLALAAASRTAWVTLDDDSLLLTTPTAAAGFVQVRGYPLEQFGPQARDAQQIEAALRTVSVGEPPQVWVDPVAKRAIVAGPAPLHAQLAVPEKAGSE
jgi:hypothetical protein